MTERMVYVDRSHTLGGVLVRAGGGPASPHPEDVVCVHQREILEVALDLLDSLDIGEIATAQAAILALFEPRLHGAFPEADLYPYEPTDDKVWVLLDRRDVETFGDRRWITATREARGVAEACRVALARESLT